MLVEDLKQNAHFVKTAAKRQERFHLLLWIMIFWRSKHRQQGLLSRPKTVCGSLTQKAQLSHQVFGSSRLSELLQLLELAIVFPGQLAKMLKIIGGNIQLSASPSILDSCG
jgi:hypothetical protein